MNIFTLIVTAFFICAMPLSLYSAEPLRFAYQHRIGDALSIIAVRQNFFAVEGLQVRAVVFNNGPACSEALFTGAADIAGMGDTAAVIAVSRNASLRIIGSQGSGERRHRIIVAANSNIRQIADLRGKRVGVKKGSSTFGGFLKILTGKGIKATDLKLVEIDPGSMPDALSSGSLDAFVASEPTPSLAEQRGGARELATLAGAGNSYPLLLLASGVAVKERAGELKRFMRAIGRAEQFIRSKPSETITILSKETGLTPEMTIKAMKRHSYRLQLDAATVKDLEKTAVFLKGSGRIKKMPDMSVVVSRQFMP